MAEALIRQRVEDYAKAIRAKDIDRVMSLCAPNIVSGATEIQPMEMFYGANSASVRDPFGHVWVLLSWKQDLDPAEMERRGNALLAR